MTDPRHDLGISAERAVEAWLQECGWQMLGRRIRSPGGGEVDLVALDPEDVLVGIEVRARRTARAGDGSESIDGRRTARIGRTLVAFAAERHLRHRGLRVDLVSVMPEPTVWRWRLRRTPNIGS